MNRRELLESGLSMMTAASLGGGAAMPLFAAEATPSLQALAKAKGRNFGSCISAGGITAGGIGNPEYAHLFQSECGILVAENETKWPALQPSPQKHDFVGADAITGWAKRNKMAMRGHNLLWQRARWMPDWVNNRDFGPTPASNAEKLIVDHINTVVGRYGSVIQDWDVVNEAINDAATGYEETSVSRAIGSVEKTMDIAFHTARRAAPNARLVYNDYMSWEPFFASQRLLVLRMLEGFRKRGTPVDALGIQSHIECLSDQPMQALGRNAERDWRSFLDEVVAMGYRLVITEFDVRDKAVSGDIAKRDQVVADYARHYFDLMLSYKQLDDIVAWGLVDVFSWLQGFAPRRDGLEVRGVPYDSNFKAKPMRDAIAASLSGAVNCG